MSFKYTRVNWPELLAICLGLVGGIGYLFTKQKFNKKLLILFLSLISQTVYIGSSLKTNIVTQTSSTQQNTTIKAPSSNTFIPLGTYKKVSENESFRVIGIETRKEGEKSVSTYITVNFKDSELHNWDATRIAYTYDFFIIDSERELVAYPSHIMSSDTNIDDLDDEYKLIITGDYSNLNLNLKVINTKTTHEYYFKLHP
jgi:hypothetical protein